MEIYGELNFICIEFYPNRMGVNDTSIVSNEICA